MQIDQTGRQVFRLSGTTAKTELLYLIQVLGPGEKDVIAFVKSDRAGAAGGISHFGFRLTSPDDMANAIETAKAAGARISKQGEFAPGLPYLYVLDPDGYEIEIWYE